MIYYLFQVSNGVKAYLSPAVMCELILHINPDSKVHVAHMGPTWDRQDPDGPHVGHVNLAIWEILIGPFFL